MADYTQILRGVATGLEAGQRFRANKQLERQREQDLESNEYDLEGRRGTRRTALPSIYGESAALPEYSSTLQDPFGVKLLGWFKNKIGGRKRRQAIQPLGMAGEEFGPPSELAQAAVRPPAPPELGGDYDSYYPEGYADGGPIARQPDMTEEELQAERAYRLRVAEQQGARNAEEDRAERSLRPYSPPPVPLVGLNQDDRRAIGRENRQNSPTSRAIGAINSAVSPALGPNFIPREESGPSTGGFRTPRAYPGQAEARRRRAIPVPEDVAGAVSAQGTQGVATESANTQPGTAPARRPAIPAQQQSAARAGQVDFSQLDVDAKEVPNMTTDDWKRYRFQLMEAARASGRPERIQQVDRMVTQMQQEGFISYGQQGLALQQAGNAKGAMAAYRAAFQYFPNGNDVEFGMVRGRDGKPVIVGFGKDEQTGKRVEGSEIVMDPERVAGLLENFQKPEAFRAWTKDWRDFQEGKRRFDTQQAGQDKDRGLRERQFNEVQKPLAQAQADSLANNSEANIVRAERAGQPKLPTPRDLQGSERTFRDRVVLLGVNDEAQADYLASVMSQIKASSPGQPDNAIIQAVMKAQQDGTLQSKLARLGIQ